MRQWLIFVPLVLAGCIPPAPPVDLNDGFTHIGVAGLFDCGPQPVSIDGSHTDVTLQGRCRHVRITGWHDDVVLYVEPGSTIEVTGSHDDVVYRLLRRGPPPQWVNRGASNELIRNSRAPWEQDHDWYQEQH
jgi:hypothetical protein